MLPDMEREKVGGGGAAYVMMLPS
uniref:Uncharacterized protein MANES_08G115100 n=1 Tax=Rhizophora mucronata TaxID=61149 RepID=A0A2P2NYA4_RHIMU